MKVQAKVEFEGGKGTIKKGQTLEVKPKVATKWIADGLVKKVK
jgi:hypothetical protein